MGEKRMFGVNFPRVNLQWVCILRDQKWAGFERKDNKRVHVATVSRDTDAGHGYIVWLDGGNGFQKVQNPDAYGFVGYPGTAKEVAEVALFQLRESLRTEPFLGPEPPTNPGEPGKESA
jgi:hypothetical protein